MKRKIIRIIASTILLIGAVIIEKNISLPIWQYLIIYLIPYLLVGYDVLQEAWEGISEGEVFNEDLLMSIATIGALCIGFLPNTETEFVEAVFVMLFFQVGEVFEDYASDNSRKSISALMDIKPQVANLLKDDEEVIEVKPEQVNIGDIIVVRPGEKIPLDGVILSGKSSLNTVALTGESMPKDVDVEDDVSSGCINLSGVLKIKVKKLYKDSTVAKIIDLVENSSQSKSKSETFIRKFAKVYTPIVVICAMVLAFIPPLFSSFAESFPIWLNRALTFLVVSCPCALVISVPLTFFGGIGGASKNGILIKGGAYMDTLSKVKTMVFDKTGTLTKGKFSVTAVHPDKISENQLLHLAAHVERFSTHPIAISLKNAYPYENDDCKVEILQEIAGEGIIARINEQNVAVGNTKLMDRLQAHWHDCHKSGTIIHVAINNEYAGHIVIADTIKDDAKMAIEGLKHIGIKRLIMLTGDKQSVAQEVSNQLGLSEFHSELLPQDKVDFVKRLVQQNSLENVSDNKVAFVGDGINDAPVLALSDVGIAMGALGSDAAIEAADVVLMDDKPSKIVTAIKIAKHTLNIASQNVVFAIAIKVLVLILAAFGIATMWMAVFADVGVMILCVLNAMRMLRS